MLNVLIIRILMLRKDSVINVLKGLFMQLGMGVSHDVRLITELLLFK